MCNNKDTVLLLSNIIACMLLYLYSEGTQRLKRNYFTITSWTVKRKARQCHQDKLRDFLEV